jgi:hypothetical protein
MDPRGSLHVLKKSKDFAEEQRFCSCRKSIPDLTTRSLGLRPTALCRLLQCVMGKLTNQPATHAT